MRVPGGLRSGDVLSVLLCRELRGEATLRDFVSDPVCGICLYGYHRSVKHLFLRCSNECLFELRRVREGVHP